MYEMKERKKERKNKSIGRKKNESNERKRERERVRINWKERKIEEREKISQTDREERSRLIN